MWPPISVPGDKASALQSRSRGFCPLRSRPARGSCLTWIKSIRSRSHYWVTYPQAAQRATVDTFVGGVPWPPTESRFSKICLAPMDTSSNVPRQRSRFGMREIERAIRAAERRFERLQSPRDWKLHADYFEVESHGVGLDSLPRRI